jgi:hypothetical protein
VVASDKKGVYVPYDPESIGISGLHFETRLSSETLSRLRENDVLPNALTTSSPALAGRIKEVAKSMQPPSDSPVRDYQLQRSDGTIRAALGRWIGQAGYQELVWDLKVDIPIERDALFRDDLLGAIESVMVALRLSSLPARACVYSNKVVRIIPSTRFCAESQ